MTVELESKAARMRRLLLAPETLFMAYIAMPIHAQMAQAAGFEACYVSGAHSAWYMGVGDLGWLSQTEVARHMARIARSVDIPILADADTGYGGPDIVCRTVDEFVSAGVAGLHLEDQAEPKKAGGADGIKLAPVEEFTRKFEAAIRTRDTLDPDFVLIARTDAYGSVGGSLDEAVHRGNAYIDVGADAIYIEGVRNFEDAAAMAEAIHGPVYCFMARDAGDTPSRSELTRMKLAMHPLRFILPGTQESWDLLLRTRDAGEAAPIDEYIQHIASLRGTERFTGDDRVFSWPSIYAGSGGRIDQ